MSRGWVSQGLKTVGDNEKYWTAAEAADMLGPPELNVDEVRRLIRLCGLKAVGKRRTTAQGVAGRHSRVYAAAELIEAYDRLSKGAHQEGNG